MLRSDKINQLIPTAMRAIQEVGIANESGEVKKVYEGYIASFGSNINQSGLLPTLVFYQNDTGKEGKSSRWLKAIYKILAPNATDTGSNALIKHVIRASGGQHGANRIGNLNQAKLDNLEEEIKDIVVALKLAVRTFKINRNDN